MHVQQKRKVQNIIGNLYSAIQIITGALNVKTRNIISKQNTAKKTTRVTSGGLWHTRRTQPTNSHPQLTDNITFIQSLDQVAYTVWGQRHAVVPTTHNNATTEQSLVGRRQWRFSYLLLEVWMLTACQICASHDNFSSLPEYSISKT